MLGYDEDGRCPMLRDDACSVYEHRPLTCRTYDCRVFAAAGIEADGAEIAQRARRWKFSYAADDKSGEAGRASSDGAEGTGHSEEDRP